MEIQPPLKKKSLKKVRSAFLNKRPDDYESGSKENNRYDSLMMIVDPRTDCLPKAEFQPLYPPLGLMEQGRKITSDYSLQSIFQRVANISIQDHIGGKSITLSLQKDPNYHFRPWQYTVRRLESYGDLDLAVWANRIRDCNENYRRNMERYFAKFSGANPEALMELKRQQRMAIATRQEIENRPGCCLRTVYFAGKDSVEMLSIAFTEGLLSGMGFTVEGLVDWVRAKGIPNIGEKDDPIILRYCLSFIESIYKESQYFLESPERQGVIIQKDGRKKKVFMKRITIFEPTTEGILTYVYHFIRSDDSVKLSGCIEDNENSKEEPSLKCYKDKDEPPNRERRT